MKKLHLDSNALRVESFEPQQTERGEGTVRAHATWDTCADIPCDPVPVDYTVGPCPPGPTSGATACGYTCGSTCTCGGCNPGTQYGWTCDPYNSQCLPVPIE